MPAFVYGALLNLFGMGSQLPFRVVNVIAATACAALLFVFVRGRTTPSFALVVVLPVLVLGTAWEALLLSLSMNFLIGLAAGLGMLLTLEIGTRRGDAAACVLLTLSVASGGIGLAFVAGASVDLILRRDPRRAWIVAVPAALIATWMLTGGESSGPDYVANALALPGYVFDAAFASFRTIVGLSPQRLAGTVNHAMLAVLLLLAAAALAARVLIVRKPPPRETVIVGTVLLAFWVLGGLAMGEGRSPIASRYQYPSAVLTIALVACLLQGVRLPRWLPLALLPLALFSVASNLKSLEDGRNFLGEQTEITRASIGRLEAIAGELENLTLTEEVTGSPYQQLIVSGPYLEAVGRFGSPAFDARQIESSGPAARRAVAGVEMAAAVLREERRVRERDGRGRPRPSEDPPSRP